MNTVQHRRRCSRACEACKKSKERCNGIVPCTLCTRRGKADRCRISGEARVDRAMEALPGLSAATDLSSVVRNDKPDPSEQSMSFIRMHEVAHFFRTSPVTDVSTRIYVGDSSTLGLLNHIRHVASDLVGQCELINDPINETMLEPQMPKAELARYDDVAHSLSTANINELVECYTIFVKGTYDLYDDGLLRQMSYFRPRVGCARVRESPKRSNLLWQSHDTGERVV